TFADLGRVFTVFNPVSRSNFLKEPEVVGFMAKYQLPDGRGRLHADVSPAFRGHDFKMTISLTLTARGAPKGGASEQITNWFDIAHEAIVRTFDEFTAPAVHALWKKRS